jgi:hypothetical protein
MNKKEKFIIFVYLAAMARDSESKTAEAARIASLASRIRDEVLPENTYNSAQVYVNYCHGRSRAFKWMKNVGFKRVRPRAARRDGAGQPCKAPQRADIEGASGRVV